MSTGGHRLSRADGRTGQGGPGQHRHTPGVEGQEQGGPAVHAGVLEAAAIRTWPCLWVESPTFPAALLSQVRVAGFRAARRRSGHTVNVHVQRRPGGQQLRLAEAGGVSIPLRSHSARCFPAPASPGGSLEPCVSSGWRLVLSWLHCCHFPGLGPHLPIAAAESLFQVPGQQRCPLLGGPALGGVPPSLGEQSVPGGAQDPE